MKLFAGIVCRKWFRAHRWQQAELQGLNCFFLKVTISRGGSVPIHLNLLILIATLFKILNPYYFDLSLLGFLKPSSFFLSVLWWVDVLSAHLSLDVEKKSPKCQIQGGFYWKSFLAICGFVCSRFFMIKPPFWNFWYIEGQTKPRVSEVSHKHSRYLQV